MTVTPPQVIVALLVKAGLVTVPSANGTWPMAIGGLPAAGDRYISIRHTGAMIEGKIHRTGVTVKHPTMQIMVRGPTHAAPDQKAEDIEVYLSTVFRETVTVNSVTVRVDSVNIVTSSTFIKQEEQNQRQLYCVNIQTTMTEV